MRIRVRSCVWVIGFGLLLTACGGTDEAKRGVADFRTLAAQKSYAEIYRTAGAELRQGTTEEQFERFMSALDRKLGAWQSADEPVWSVTRGTGGHLVRLTYQSQFTNGPASEQFLWRIERGGPALLGYHVNSVLLATQ
jgi:hypothetical protein